MTLKYVICILWVPSKRVGIFFLYSYIKGGVILLALFTRINDHPSTVQTHGTLSIPVLSIENTIHGIINIENIDTDHNILTI